MNVITPIGSRPQAFVKIVPSGGTKNKAGIKSQLEYLGRDGDVPIERSVRHQNIALGQKDYADLAKTWSERAQNRVGGTRNQELTTHIVVSFPAETDHEKAKAASRAWAERMFGHGDFGGKFDYVTTFHTDTPHPHMHVIVNRRAHNNDAWLKISKRDPYMNYDNMRNTLVEKAAQHGIYLDASSRESRGLQGNPITLATYHRLARQDVFFSTQHDDNGVIDPGHYEGDDANVRGTPATLAGNRRNRDASDTAEAPKRRRTQEALDQTATAGPPIPQAAGQHMELRNKRAGTGQTDAGYEADTEGRSTAKRRRRETPNEHEPNAGSTPRSR